MIENINRPDEPHPDMASQFLTRFDEERIFTFQTFADCKTSKASYLTRILHGTFDEHHRITASESAGSWNFFHG